MPSESVARFSASFFASGLAEVMTLPIDITKVRLQVQTTGAATAGGAPVYKGMVDCMAQIVRHEGPLALFNGLTPSLMRQMSYTSIMMTIYQPIRNAMADLTGDSSSSGGGGSSSPSQPSFGQRLAAGGLAGAIGISLMNPTEVLKTQMQAATKRRPMRSVVQQVWQTEGLVGFWAGVKPNVARCFLVNAAELGTYDQAKTSLVEHGLCKDGSLVQHVGASGIAGFVSACVSTPVDVVKTRLMNDAGGLHHYRSMAHALVAIPRAEGFTALYKGFVPILCRKLLWCTVFFVSYEQLHLLFKPAPDAVD